MPRTNAGPWTYDENRATVGAYFSIWMKIANGEKVNRAAEYRALAAQFPQRSNKAFEFKAQNISAALQDLDFAFCPGLKPCKGYQRELRTHIKDWIANSGADQAGFTIPAKEA
jgi:hypothetical protein